VIHAVEQMNYRPLRRRAPMATSEEATLQGKNIALVLLGMDRSLETLPVVAAAIHGAESAVAEAGGNLLLADSPDLSRAPAWLGREQIHGVILKGALQGDTIGKTRNAFLDTLRELPGIWLLGKPEGCWGDVAGSDDLLIGRIAADHLIDRGHRQLAFVNPKADHVTFGRRQAGFVFRAQERQIDVRLYVGTSRDQCTLPLQRASEVECVQALVDRVLEDAVRPTAIFCPGDSIAALVYRALAHRKVLVGHEISLISSNNEASLIASLYPSLTTIDVHARTIGRRAVDQLTWRMSHGTSSPPMGLNVLPILLEGDSVATLG
jgi:LacI family transcriptional regulator